MEYPNSISSKLPQVGTTIFAVMSKLANECGAINLSQGFPDFESSPVLIELVNKYMKKGYNQYAPMHGVVGLLEILAEKVKGLYGTSYSAEKEITVTPGATYAIFTTIQAMIHEGDEVIIFTPAYDCYAPAVELAGGKPVYIQLEAPEYTINWENTSKLINSKTKMIIINTPHNPTGSVLSEEDMKQLASITRNSNIVILSDEVYEHILFDDIPHQSVAKYPELAERSFAVFSFGKTFHNTGWKMGYVLAPSNLMDEFCKVHQFNVFTCNTPIQYALADFLKDKQNYLELGAMYQEKRDLFLDLVKESRFKPVPCYGTYFQLLDYSDITDEPDTEYAVRMTKESGLASIPVSVFYHKKVDNRVLRFCFAKTEETLQRAAEVLCKI